MLEFCEWTVASPDFQALLLILFFADLLTNMKSGSLRVWVPLDEWFRVNGIQYSNNNLLMNHWNWVSSVLQIL